MRATDYLRMVGRAKVEVAEIEYIEAENENGFDSAAIYATCGKSCHRVGPIWGHGEKSVKRALATLTDTCPCGAHFHEEE